MNFFLILITQKLSVIRVQQNLLAIIQNYLFKIVFSNKDSGKICGWGMGTIKIQNLFCLNYFPLFVVLIHSTLHIRYRPFVSFKLIRLTLKIHYPDLVNFLRNWLRISKNLHFRNVLDLGLFSFFIRLFFGIIKNPLILNLTCLWHKSLRLYYLLDLLSILHNVSQVIKYFSINIAV